jgi:hypothetical protein
MNYEKLFPNYADSFKDGLNDGTLPGVVAREICAAVVTSRQRRKRNASTP